MNEKLIYGDPEADGHHVVVTLGIWVNPIDEFEFTASQAEFLRIGGFVGGVEVDGDGLGYLPAEYLRDGLISDSSNFPFEMISDGQFRALLMQTNPLPSAIPEDADVVLTEDNVNRVRHAQVTFPVASVVAHLGTPGMDGFSLIPAGADVAAIYVDGDPVRH